MKTFLKNPFSRCLSRFRETFFRSAFPPRCRICGEYMHPPFADEQKWEETDIRCLTYEQIMDTCLCPKCLPDREIVKPPFCPVCGLMNKDRKGKARICENCFSRHFRKCRSFGTYDRGLKNIVHQYKYLRKTSLARPLGLLIFTVFARYWSPGECDLLMPVPLHTKKYRKRGFNQSYLLVKNWPDLARKYRLPHLQTDCRNLVRIRATKAQADMTKEMRIRNVQDAFRLCRPEKVKGKKILLVDDILTTGATADECARVLREAGAEQVDVITLARTLRYL